MINKFSYRYDVSSIRFSNTIIVNEIEKHMNNKLVSSSAALALVTAS